MELKDCLNLREEIISLKYKNKSFVEHFFVGNKITKITKEDNQNMIKPECLSGNLVTVRHLVTVRLYSEQNNTITTTIMTGKSN